MTNCLICDKQTKRATYKYCSNKCQQMYQYQQYIATWKQGLVSGSHGIHAKNISRYLRRYLSEKFGEEYSLCHWNKRHPVTKKVPLEIDHINGNAEDNTEGNLRLICPNCHALSPTFRNLNKGKGREWRLKYLKTRWVAGAVNPD